MEKNVKFVDLLSTYDNMDSKKTIGQCLKKIRDSKNILEERLRKAASVGDIDAVQELLKSGVDVNAQDIHSGWTALHWACRNGYFDVAALLLMNGAFKYIKSNFGETPKFVSTKPQILKLLDAVDSKLELNDITMHNNIPKYLKNDFVHGTVDSEIHRMTCNGLYTDELILKIRIADALDPDFIEVEICQNNLTYQTLIDICCQELNIDCTQIVKLRKLPNTKLRKDKDIQRLQNFQEIEVVTNAVNTHKYVQNTSSVQNNIPTVPANGYQSISKKDQTILY
ncbi:ankyrin repeat domain-containing protein 40 isoform X1 [Nomia melanderi]|uniref:ankyrin repeat domain-containing protein 40 isoform X1 n=1 Tax=Nomia melanderi TaxID=2448451 RepID=UPI0013043E19|nr:ankyrin repeat domain-containing protein 40-like isoform X2 [Nomia melanderi]